MALRKILLRLMLGSLAVSALGGALAVLASSTDVVWRVVGTGATAAVASALLLVLSLLIDKPKSRAAGLLGMAGVVGAFILSLPLIWDILPASNVELPVALTMLAVIGAALPGMFFLRVMFAARGEWAGIVGAAGCAVGFLTIITGIWVGEVAGGSFRVSENLEASAWAVALFCTIAAASLAGSGVDRRWWRWVGVAAAAIGGAMAVAGIWIDAQKGDEALAMVSSVAVIVGYTNLALLCPLKPGQHWLQWGAIAAVVVTAALVDAIIFRGADMPGEDLLTRGAGAAAIIAACGSLALLILARLNRQAPTVSVPANVSELTVICPWCQRKQSLPLGASACAGCGLKFRISVEEPRCQNCDYLLYMLTSDRCPECGTALRPATATVQA